MKVVRWRSGDAAACLVQRRGGVLGCNGMATGQMSVRGGRFLSRITGDGPAPQAVCTQTPRSDGKQARGHTGAGQRGRGEVVVVSVMAACGCVCAGRGCRSLGARQLQTRHSLIPSGEGARGEGVHDSSSSSSSRRRTQGREETREKGGCTGARGGRHARDWRPRPIEKRGEIRRGRTQRGGWRRARHA